METLEIAAFLAVAIILAFSMGFVSGWLTGKGHK